MQSEGAGTFTCHRFSGNGVALQNDTTRNQQATNDWWGCNEGPGSLGCDPLAGAGPVVVEPVMVLAASASPTTIENGGSSTIAADMSRDALGDLPPACTLPEGIPVFFSLAAGAGTVLPSPVDTVADQAASAFIAAAPDTQLQATLPAALLAAPGTIAVRVRNPPPGGGLSNELPFEVAAVPIAEVPTLSAIGLGLLALLLAGAARRRLAG